MFTVQIHTLKKLFGQFQSIVGRWAERTFPDSTPSSIIKHMKKEVRELEYAARYESHEKYCMELADIFLMLMHLAYKAGTNLIFRAFKKHAINKLRRWGKPDKYGVVEHIRSNK
jgi:NTP pyrophosphatase (non-canonical NTP hydrolase)